MSNSSSETSPSNWLAALLLCIFLGTLGIHRFYVGKVGTGILMLLTGGGLGIWWLIDIILIATSQFRDMQGRLLKA
jgi:TM2 domain-containing membrane protein YozV